MSSDEELRQKARMRAGAKISFYIHLSVYAGVNFMLFLIWLFTGGIGLVAHYMSAFAYSGYFDRMTEEEYRKLKQEQQQH
jgi:CRISPR/Cas system CSM-associated protein Csm3 (group 7 of RAMP superfamily)